MINKKYKMAIIEDNPVPYRTPIYKEISKVKEIEHTVYFCSNEGLKDFYDPESKKNIKFHTDIKGFKSKFLKNYFPTGKVLLPKGLWNFGIINELMKNKYDAILTYGYSSLPKKLTYISAKLSRTPIIFKEEINEVSGGRIKRFLKRIIYRELFKLPDVFLYSYMKNKEFYRTFGVPEEKLFFCPCAVDNKLYQELARKTEKQKVRKKLKIPKDANVFLSVGTIYQRKGVFNTLRAFEKLGGENNYLIYLGGGVEKKKLQEYVRNRKMKNVRFFSFRSKPEELAEFYSAADVFVMASISDPSPKVLNEAMNFSLPVIASEGVGTAHDLVKQNKNGFIIHAGNIEELSRAMKKIIFNEKLRKRMGKESLKIVSKWNFDEDVKAILKALNYIYKNEKN